MKWNLLFNETVITQHIKGKLITDRKKEMR